MSYDTYGIQINTLDHLNPNPYSQGKFKSNSNSDIEKPSPHVYLVETTKAIRKL